MSDVEEAIEEPVEEQAEENFGAGDDFEEEEEFVAVGGATEVKLFGKWSFDDIEIRDISLVDYIAVKGDHATYLPHTAGRYQKKRFRKASCPIVERLACCLMRKGRNSGKKLMAVRIVQHTLEIIHLLTDQNPVQVVVDGLHAEVVGDFHGHSLQLSFVHFLDERLFSRQEVGLALWR